MSDTFEFTYPLQVSPPLDDENVFEVQMIVSVLVEPAEPEVGIPHRSLSIENIKIMGISEEESNAFWDQIGMELQIELEVAAEDALKKIEETYEPYDDERPVRRW